MYCRQCGRELPEQAAFCSSCGANTGMPAGTAAAASTAGTTQNPTIRTTAATNPTTADGRGGRVARHLTALTILWLIMGLLRLLPGLFLLGMGGVMSHGMRPWMTHGMGFPGMMGHQFAAGFMVLIGWLLLGFALLSLLTAWGIYQREDWGRILAIVMSVISLLSIPFGTALGIYTLWVLAPEESGREWQALEKR